MVLQSWGFTRVPAYLKQLLDEITGGNAREEVLRIIFWALVLTAITGAATFLMRLLIISSSRRIEYELRDRIYRKLLALDFSFYQNRQTGDIISRCTNDLNDVRTLLGPGLMYIPNTISQLAFFIPVLIVLNGPMTLVLVGLMATLVVAIVIILPRFRPRFRQVQEYVGRINDRAWQIITGIATVKLYAMEQVETRRFEDLNNRYVRVNMGLVRIRGLLFPFFMFLFGLSEVLILAAGGRAVIENRMSIGELLQYATMAGILTFPILSLGWVMTLLQQGISAMERISTILDHEVPTIEQPVAVGDGELTIEAQDVHYTYPTGELEALTGVDLSLHPGETLGITGGVGSGKSTFLLLLTGIIRPSHGALTVNGIDTASVDTAQLLDLIAFVPQETFLFSRSVAANIAMGAPGAPEPTTVDSQVRDAADRAAVGSDIETFPEGYGQLVGERGITLSGGQKQRLAIARALIRNGRVLILDDSLSSVDAETETRILTSLTELKGSRSIVIVSHRVSALKLADRIAVFEDGTVVESGSHDELVTGDGPYARMAALQQLEQEVLR